jgi:hypothetical protein
MAMLCNVLIYSEIFLCEKGIYLRVWQKRPQYVQDADTSTVQIEPRNTMRVATSLKGAQQQADKPARGGVVIMRCPGVGLRCFICLCFKPCAGLLNLLAVFALPLSGAWIKFKSKTYCRNVYWTATY